MMLTTITNILFGTSMPAIARTTKLADIGRIRGKKGEGKETK